jgi:hypothetical protein
MILYVLLFIILSIALFFIYVRLKYQFWALQPVFHFYDFYYWFVNIGIIRKQLPEKNRYVNLNKIKTKHFEELDELTKKQILILIQLNYYRNNENKYAPKMENILPYFIGHNLKTFCSYFIYPEILIDNKTGKTIDQNNIIGVITSRPLHVKINCKRHDSEFDVYYVDYLCVNKNWRKKNIAPQLIQTHEYNQSHFNTKICVSLFKREEELTAIIPLTVFKTYCFTMKNWIQAEPLEANISLLTGDKQNIFYLYHFINEVKNNWDIIIYPEISNIIELVLTHNLFVKMLVLHGNIEAVYIFRKTCTFIEKEKEIISSICSIKGHKLTNDQFIKGFKLSLWSIIKDHNNFKYLTMEELSDNTCIINNICIKTIPKVICPMAYFFYNFAYSTFKSEKCLIIN